MTLDEARALAAKAETKQVEASQRAKQKEKALLAEARAVIAAAEKAATANGVDHDG